MDPLRLNPKGIYVGSGMKIFTTEKRNDNDIRVQFW
jgi:hypothetical protein